MTPDPISDEARKCAEEIVRISPDGVCAELLFPSIQRHLDAYAKREVEKALAEVKCYNCGELAVRL